MPTHFTNGVSNRAVGNTLYDWGYLDPTKYHTYFNDFDTIIATDWVFTTTEAGSGSATEAIQDEAGGVLKLTNDDADNDNDFLQLVPETFKWSSTKEMFFCTRFKVSDATQSDLVIGLQIRDTTPLDVTDGLFFTKADGSASMTFSVEKNNTATSTTVGTLVSDTYVRVGFFYNPLDYKFHIFLNDVEVASSVNTNAVDDEELTVSIGLQNGEAVAKTMSVDYILVSQER